MVNNYSKYTEKVLEEIKNSPKKPTLLLHVCCAPCSSYVLEYLNAFFEITLYYYNPNISPESEYNFRLNELSRLVAEMPNLNNVKIVSETYNPADFFETVKGLEPLPEGGERCKKCYRLRLNRSAKYAFDNGFNFFTTTLSISPHKNANWLNEIGEELSRKYNVQYLFSDFKKKNGYKRSIELSVIYNLYRQDYCGCVYSKEFSKSRNI